MKPRYLLLLPLLLTLTGCKEDFATLHFQDSVRSDPKAGPQYSDQLVHEAYKQSIYTALSAQGLDPDAIALERDKEDDKVIHLRLVDYSLSPEQRGSLKALFEQVTQARNASSMNLRLELDNAHASVKPSGSSELPDRIDASLEFEPEFGMLLDRSYDDSMQAIVNESEIEGPVSCKITARLAMPTSLKLIAYEALEKDNSARGLISLLTRSGSIAKVELKVHFDDPDLTRHLQQDTVHAWPSSSRITQPAPVPLDEFAFVIGSIGVQTLTSALPFDTRKDELQALCDQKMQSLGRPFTFQMGRTLDRLTRVDYR
ncbi:hypothetical protein GV819_06375 [Pseudomonas sp. Fl5BN2]|uniref:hypothetical protein n=1 Tax=unclassified Pseudomonas TaxID=196821 RepID=UPI001376694F|nr:MULTISPECIES: hypothetical protein [unclassified Pseudomonas]NBF01913.1 hypothetical protein [Pseudomonas sp. Fl5BN2]NBF07405.1 hypothetical protein [Pseudomonas sp. Fl4BN1]